MWKVSPPFPVHVNADDMMSFLPMFWHYSTIRRVVKTNQNTLERASRHMEEAG